MSELKLGRVWKVQGSGGSYVKTLWIDGFNETLGLTRDPAKTGFFYGVGKLNDAYVAYRASSAIPNSYAVIATLPRLGNGLWCHYASGKLYTASEGNFLPGGGSVYEVDPATGKVIHLSDTLWAADGLFIDQSRHLLYVGELKTSVYVWDLSQSPPIYLGKLPGFEGILDDFTVAEQGLALLGCDWLGNRLVQFNSYPTNGSMVPTTVVSAKDGLHTPTSARFGEDPTSTDPFPSSALFVTEGRTRDYVIPGQMHDRLLRIDFSSGYSHD